MKREKTAPGKIKNSYFDEKMARRKMVSQKEYLTWLIGFMQGRGLKYIDDESVLYDDTLTADNKEKLLAISALYSLIEDFCMMHNIQQKIYEEKKVSFPHGEYIFEGDGYYFSIFTMVGQGALTIFTILSKEEAERLCDFFIAIDDILK